MDGRSESVQPLLYSFTGLSGLYLPPQFADDGPIDLDDGAYERNETYPRGLQTLSSGFVFRKIQSRCFHLFLGRRPGLGDHGDPR